MLSSRSIRVVVILLLIVTMAMQPGFAENTRPDGQAKCSIGYMCDGCGCCQVATPTERCCCCSGDDQDASSDEGCCAGEHGVVEAETASAAGTELQLSDSAVTAPTARHGQVESVSTPLTSVQTVCHCGVARQPMSLPTLQRQSESQRDSVTLQFADLILIYAPELRCSAAAVSDAVVTGDPHFSQRRLCIWRL